MYSDVILESVKNKVIKMNNEVYAAIAMALHDDLGYNLHDSESGRLTIVARDSEWSSKAAKMTAKV